MVDKGYKEVTLLGQNVNSFHWNEDGAEVGFADLMRMVAAVSPSLRVRFATSHPKDISDELIETIAEVPNICNSIHLPVQSGSSSCLNRMKRVYTREWYLNRIEKIKELIPDCGLSQILFVGLVAKRKRSIKIRFL